MLRYTIGTLVVVVALVGIDFAWLRTMSSEHSVLGFRRGAFDFGVLPMFNLLVLGLYILLFRRPRRRRFLVALEVGGMIALFTYCACTWLWPDIVRETAGLVFDPVWGTFFGWVPPGTPYPYLILYWTLVSATLTAPQLLFGLACGVLALRISRTGGGLIDACDRRRVTPPDNPAVDMGPRVSRSVFSGLLDGTA